MRRQLGGILCIVLLLIHFAFILIVLFRVFALDRAREIVHIVIFVLLDQGLKVGGIDVVINVAIVVRHGGILGRESPLPVHYKLIPRHSKWSY